ncbi:UDP-N-acetylglucosamine 2-epimerase (non-hydrolyzing) [Prolixibacteraceae bacterium JC049]|nr:UDP-N-acetylglucosamine 2-epimerase (non-hydrolyzing) [Prolixibacteraceae bacterium JC049]
MSKKIVTIVGARPQFVKAAAVSRELRKEFVEILVHTGQHFDQNMSEVFFQEMEIPTPDYNLEINGVGHGAMTGRMLEKIEEVLLKEKPDMVLVYGDTNSTIAGALAASKIHIPVAHVEAGLRSFNMEMPEEINRILTDRISNILFCPTTVAVDNLKQEGFDNFNNKIVCNGDVMQDAAIYYSQFSDEKSTVIAKNELDKKSFVLATIHRQENTDDLDNLQQIVAAFNEINKTHRVVFPMHPRTRNIIAKHEIKMEFEPIDPVGYFDMIELLKKCEVVITDSGGLQKEAFFFGKHCVTAREQTEWVELINNGFNIVTGADKQKIIDTVALMAQKESNFDIDLYGKGEASSRIVKTLKEYLN